MLEYAKTFHASVDAFFEGTARISHQVQVFHSPHYAMIRIIHRRSVGRPQVQVERVDAGIGAHFDCIGSRLLRSQPQWLYFDRNLRVFAGRTTYLFKPLERLHWLRSQALLDADAFIAEKVATAGRNS
jgi:hypothetical protein